MQESKDRSDLSLSESMEPTFPEILRGFGFLAPLLLFLLAFILIPVTGTMVDSLSFGTSPIFRSGFRS